MKEASWINVVLGIWLLLAPWQLHFTSGAMVGNSAGLGLLVLLVSGLSLLVSDTNHGFAWINIGLGGWVIVSPWVLGYGATTSLWNAAIVGGLIVVFALIRTTSGRPLAAGPRVG